MGVLGARWAVAAPQTSTARRLAIAGGVVGALAVIGAGGWWVARPWYRPPRRDQPPAIAAPAALVAAAPGRLQVDVVPRAQVALDGAPLGVSPIDAAVAAGRHRLSLLDPATGAQSERAIDVVPGGVVSVKTW